MKYSLCAYALAVGSIGSAGSASADPIAPCAPTPAGKVALGSGSAQTAVQTTQSGANERSRVEVAPAGHPFTHLVVDNALGDVRVEGYDGTAMCIETHKHAPDDDTLDRLRVSLVPGADGTVRITTNVDGGHEVKPVARGAVRVDLLIHAPHGTHVELAASSGGLALEDMDAGGELDTASGPIVVKNVQGEVWTHSLTGSTQLAQVFGIVDAQALTADLDFDTIRGERLVASVEHGKITGRAVRSRDIELTTTDGKIVLDADVGLRSRISVASLRGDVDVRVHRKGAINVRARGAKVDLGALAANPPQLSAAQVDGWRQIALGSDPAAGMIEVSSPYGSVQFVVVQ